ncbi:MAG TPA: arginine--tRNA ligase [Nitrospiria bacterium]|jgi:arginyl-tRNA synthetase|nr:arginine--tRNA ligase [Nitrospiria bacterium]
MTKDRLIKEMILKAWERACEEGKIRSRPDPDKVVVEIPKETVPADFATTVAMMLAPIERRPPREIAQVLQDCLRNETQKILEDVQLAGPGYINLTLKQDQWRRVLPEIEEQGKRFGRVDSGKGQWVQVEFVSANPTGPLHVGHGRWAAVGNALANLLEAAGDRVHREYYNNDSGRQVKLLGLSVYARYQQILGHPVPDPEDGYRGGYVAGIAQGLADRYGDQYRGRGAEECLEFFTRHALEEMTGVIREDLSAFGITFDDWFSEASLYQSGAVQNALDELREKDFLYEKDGALWFRSTHFGDDKDRVVRKEDGEFTYLASDIAYHRDKLARGFDLLIDIWGADHHGYTARMEAAVQALGYPKTRLRILIGQLVKLVRNGQPVPMSKRAGEFVTLRDVVDEVGKDAALFFFLMRRLDSPMDFDLELAKRQSNENPVYYVQYAHARLCSVGRQAAEQGIRLKDPKQVRLDLLTEPEELKLMKRLDAFPKLIEEGARALEPHRLTFYLLDLAGLLHNYYFKHRIISANEELTQARLLMVGAVRTVMANALAILGVTAPERM